MDADALLQLLRERYPRAGIPRVDVDVADGARVITISCARPGC